MLVHLNREGMMSLITALQRLPCEGKSIRDVVKHEHTRQASIRALLRQVKHIEVRSSTTPTDNPTTVIDDYWGVRLGLSNG